MRIERNQEISGPVSAMVAGAQGYRGWCYGIAMVVALGAGASASAPSGGLQDPGTPALRVTFSHDQVYEVDGLELEGGSFEIAFEKAFLVNGDTPLGPTVVVLIGEGSIRLRPEVAESHATEVEISRYGNVVREAPVELPTLTDSLESVYLRVHPRDPMLTHLEGKPVFHEAAFETAQEIHRKKFPGTFSKNGRALIPRRGIRSLDFEGRELGRVVIIDAPRSDLRVMLLRETPPDSDAPEE